MHEEAQFLNPKSQVSYAFIDLKQDHLITVSININDLFFNFSVISCLKIKFRKHQRTEIKLA
jgi:hypothetical protein